MLENLNPKESLEIEEQRKLSELNERRTQELLETAGKVQDKLPIFIEDLPLDHR